MSLTAEQIQQMITQGITEGLKRRDADDKQDAMQKNYDELKAKYDALMAKLKGKKGEGGEEDDKDKEDGGEKKKDSAQDFQAHYTQRRKLEELATAYRIDSKKVSELDNAALAKAIVLAARPGVRQDGDERYYLEALDFIEAPQEGRQDSDPAPNPYTHIEQGFKQAEGQRRDGNPQPTPSPSSNWLQGMNKQFQSRHA